MTTTPFTIIYEALRAAGVEHAQLREHYTGHILGALADAALLPPTRTCGSRWDNDQICALPLGHAGWHASNPRYDPERGEVHAGSTWSPGRTRREFTEATSS